MSMQPLISVIVPVYNVSPYLKRCFDSLKCQTLYRVEFIVIDDGSTDGSGKICDSYAARDSRFRIIHKKNEGLSAARNEGVRIAHADYIMFVDSDDWVDPDFCRIPFLAAKKYDADLVMFGFAWMKNGKTVRKTTKHTPAGPITKQQAINALHSRDSESTVWNKMYHRNLFETIMFPVGKLYEDIGTTYKFVHASNQCCFIPKQLYHYEMRRKGSITASGSIKGTKDIIEMVMKKDYDLLQWGYGNHYIKKDSFNILISKGRILGITNKVEERIKHLRGIPSYFTWKQKLLFIIYKFSPTLFDLICILWRKRNKYE